MKEEIFEKVVPAYYVYYKEDVEDWLTEIQVPIK